MKAQTFFIPVDAHDHVSAILTLPDGGQEAKPRLGVITAHGAGNDMNNPLLVSFAEGLAAGGYPALRFNFPYKEKGLKAPDRMETLMGTWAAVLRFFRDAAGIEADGIIAAGKSMGGRVASLMAAEGRLPVQGLVFLGYPLHPAGDREKIRDAHLYRIPMPMLFFAGSRDPLCDLTRLQSVLGRLNAPWDLDVIEGGDHSFHIAGTPGADASAVYDRIVRKTRQWFDGI